LFVEHDGKIGENGKRNSKLIKTIMNVQLWVWLDARVPVAYRRVHTAQPISENKRVLYVLNPVLVT